MTRSQSALARLLAIVLVVGCDALPGASTDYVAIPGGSAAVLGMTQGPDGNVWFAYLLYPEATGGQKGAIGSVSTTGEFHEFLSPAILRPSGIAAGRDGALWFADDTEIGRITTHGQITKFPLPGTHARSIAEGTDRKLWFTETEDQIGSIDLDGTITEYPLPVKGANLTSIAGAPDGIWFVENGRNRIGRLNPAGRGTFVDFPIPTPRADVQAIVLALDGNLWFTERGAGKIGRVSTGGEMTEFSDDPSAQPFGIVAAPDGTLWYGDVAGRLGHITPTGKISEVLLKQYNQTLWITFGADGRLWFTAAGQIGRLNP